MEGLAANETLLAAAHAVARGGELDSKLDSLAEQARSLAGAATVVIYVLDPIAMSLVPAAAAGSTMTLGAETGIPIDSDELAARAVRERRRATEPGAVALPLIFADTTGAEEPEGGLLVTFATPAATSVDGSLAAIADLCAVAIHQARLQNALVERAEWIDRVASSDSLTGLPNRASFERMLELELARSVRQGSELSIAVLDVDGMSEINEQAGAEVGDDFLRRVASLLAEQVRVVDSIARVGPDEFGLVAPGGGGAIVVRRVRDAAASVPAPEGAELSLSAAVVVFPHDGATSDELLGAAAAALDEAKRRGRGSVVATREP